MGWAANAMRQIMASFQRIFMPEKATGHDDVFIGSHRTYLPAPAATATFHLWETA